MSGELAAASVRTVADGLYRICRGGWESSYSGDAAVELLAELAVRALAKLRAEQSK